MAYADHGMLEIWRACTIGRELCYTDLRLLGSECLCLIYDLSGFPLVIPPLIALQGC